MAPRSLLEKLANEIRFSSDCRQPTRTRSHNDPSSPSLPPTKAHPLETWRQKRNPASIVLEEPIACLLPRRQQFIWKRKTTCARREASHERTRSSAARCGKSNYNLSWFLGKMRTGCRSSDTTGRLFLRRNDWYLLDKTSSNTTQEHVP